MYYVYVLLCLDASLYTGISPNPTKRLVQHQKGRGGAYTRSHPPLRIIYTEVQSDRSSALKREAIIKSWPRKKKLLTLGLKI